jgi:hypothetical protein
MDATALGPILACIYSCDHDPDGDNGQGALFRR